MMLRKDIEDKFPFLSVVTYGGNEYVGIVCNQDNFITSMYVYSELQTDRHRDLFLEMGETWWWEGLGLGLGLGLGSWCVDGAA